MKTIIFTIALLVPLQLLACFCVDSTSFADHLKRTEYHIFKGRVVMNILDTNIVTRGHPFDATTFEVLEDFTHRDGKLGCNKVTVEQFWTTCDKHFEVDSIYLVFTTKTDGYFRATSLCRPNRRFSRLSAEELELLGEGGTDFEDCVWRDMYGLFPPEQTPKQVKETDLEVEAALDWRMVGLVCGNLILIALLALVYFRNQYLKIQ